MSRRAHDGAGRSVRPLQNAKDASWWQIPEHKSSTSRSSSRTAPRRAGAHPGAVVGKFEKESSFQSARRSGTGVPNFVAIPELARAGERSALMMETYVDRDLRSSWLSNAINC